MHLRRFSPQLILSATAAFAILWAIARACVQSITIDEADTYLVWVARPNPSHWEAASNNHVLNSLLMRLTTSVFGPSHLSVRAPALFGALIYIAMCWWLCRLLLPHVSAQWPLFAALVYNPFIFDHLVAARGYSLALGFLMAALAVAAHGHARDWPMTRAAAACSVCLSLSFAANFSFAFVDAFAMAAILIWACARTHTAQARVRVSVAGVLPGALVALFLSAPAVLYFPRGDLLYGAHSLKEMFAGVVSSSLFELNPQIVNPLLLHALVRIAPILLPALLLLAAWQWLRWDGFPFIFVLLGILACALTAHWLAFRILNLPLPKDRTAIWIVPLVTLAAGAVAPRRSALTVALYALSFYYLLCLRLTYFKEWSWDADVNRVYAVLARYNHTCGLNSAASNWMYSSTLNYYRVASGGESFDEITGAQKIPADRDLYVLNYAFDEQFLKDQRLHVVYRGPTTDAVVAVRDPLTCPPPFRKQ